MIQSEKQPLVLMTWGVLLLVLTIIALGYGGDGDDVIKDSSGGNSLNGGLGDDSITGGLGNDTIIGGDGNDKITDTLGNNNIDGGAGDDSITGASGNDTIIGGSGNDSINGGSGNDSINGEDGDDEIRGGTGDDTLTGGAGSDKFIIDSLVADTYTITDFSLDEDTLTISNVKAIVNVIALTSSDYNNGNVDNKGTLSITVQKSEDTSITGTITGINSIVGAGGNDTITGGSGNDTLIGGAGNDTITGGDGIDSMTGGAGDDTFVFSGELNTKSVIYTDLISDFRIGSDKLSGFGVEGSSENVLFADKPIDSLTSLLKNADDKLDGAIKFYVGQVIGTSDAYLVTDNDGLGYTHVIKLTGVTLTTFLSSDILS